MYNYQINAINLFLEVLKNSSYLWMLQLQAIRKPRDQRTLFRNDFPETTTEKPASKVSLCSCEWDHRNVNRSMICSSVENMRNIRLSVKGSERNVIQTPKYKTQEQPQAAQAHVSKKSQRWIHERVTRCVTRC